MTKQSDYQIRNGIISHDRLKDVINYSPNTGDIIATASRGRVKQGDVLGSLDKGGYVVLRIDNREYKGHRIAWFYTHGEWPNGQMDHINHIKNDNRLKNIRVVSDAENKKNLALSKDNTSGITGVYWFKPAKLWKAQINVNGKGKVLGYFKNRLDAAECRKKAEVSLGYHVNHGAKNA